MEKGLPCWMLKAAECRIESHQAHSKKSRTLRPSQKDRSRRNAGRRERYRGEGATLGFYRARYSPARLICDIGEA